MILEGRGGGRGQILSDEVPRGETLWREDSPSHQ